MNQFKKIIFGIKKIINNYHRYFVNQVANDICTDPFELERLFYHNFISYSVVKPSSNKLWKIIVDRTLLILTGYMSLYIMYKTLFDNIKELEIVSKYTKIINPIVLISIFVLVIVYGYGIYKPTEQEQSPMLEIDKCRNIFSKVVNTQLNKKNSKKKTRLFLVIDDLDRIKENLQVKIISLLYNEYYPLKIDGVELIFIFMLNTHKIRGELSNSELTSYKLFDYILPVSNNQKYIIRHLTNKMINEHSILSEIFNNDVIKNKEYIINLICKEYNTIRKIKHFFNKLISKYNYIKSKNVENINYDEMIIISLLLGQIETSALDDAIANLINSEPINDIENNIKEILVSCNNLKIFDIDYYIYLYNFIDVEDILNHYENEIYLIADKGYGETNFEEDNKIIDYLENKKVRYDVVFHQIFIFLDNDTKLIFTASKKFCEYLVKSANLHENISITNAYKNDYGYYLCDNISLTKADKDKIIFDLKKSRETYLSSGTSDNYNNLKNTFVEFLKKMDNRIINFSLKEYFALVKIDDEIYKILFEDVTYKNMAIGFYLLDTNIIDCNYIKQYIDIPFLTKIDKLELETAIRLKNKIINTNDISFDVLTTIISKQNEKYDNIDSVYDKINQFDSYISLDKLKKILNNYGYNIKLDKHIIKNMDEKPREIIEFINKKRYELSKDLLEKINAIKTVYQFTNYYEKMFIDNGYYSLYIYSRIIKNKMFDINKNYINDEKYKNALLNNYKVINDWASKYKFTKDYSLFIIDKVEFNTIVFSNINFWKIKNLIPNIDDFSIINDILKVLRTQNKLENFIDYCIKNGVDIDFIKYLRSYAEEFGMSKKTKTKLTRLINKSKTGIK